MPVTSIEWTDVSWPLANGCRAVSPGCENCYSARLSASRLRNTDKYRHLALIKKTGPQWTGESRFWAKDLAMPLRLRKPSKIFVANMGDLFYEGFTNEQIAAVFGVMAACPQHTFQVLTKRPERMVEWFAWLRDQRKVHVMGAGPVTDVSTCSMAALDYERETHPLGDSGPLHTKFCADVDVPWPLANVWLGVSCEDQQHADERIPLLLQTPAVVRWISAEPLLGPLDITRYLKATLVARDGERLQHPDPRVPGAGGTWEVTRLNWVVNGGESGPGARPCNVDWIRSIVQQCSDRYANVPCFTKQLGAHPYEEFPAEGGWLPPSFGGWVRDGDRFVKKHRLSDRKGGTMSQWPYDELKVRQMPEATP